MFSSLENMSPVFQICLMLSGGGDLSKEFILAIPWCIMDFLDSDLENIRERFLNDGEFMFVIPCSIAEFQLFRNYFFHFSSHLNEEWVDLPTSFMRNGFLKLWF